MRVDGKISAGYAIVCNCGAAFAVERLGDAVECPECGHTKLGVDIAAEYYLDTSRPVTRRSRVPVLRGATG